MPNFRYNATDAVGKWVSGEAQGASRAEVEARLAAEGLTVEGLIEAAESRATPAEWVELVEQLEGLTRAGLPLPSGLRAAGAEVTSPGLRSAFVRLADRLEGGSELGPALGSASGRLPAPLRGLVAAGNRSGRLADLLAEYVRAANVGSELRRVFWSTLAYPIVALVLVLGVVYGVCVLSTLVINATQSVDLSIVLGGPRRQAGSLGVLLAVSQFLSGHGAEIGVALALVPLTAWATLRFLMGPAKARRLACSAPLLGPVLESSSLAEFCHLLAMLIEADVPLPEALELAGRSVADADVAEACARIGREVAGGRPLSEAVEAWSTIPAGLGQLLGWSEGRRNLPEALHMAGDMFEARAKSQSSFAAAILATVVMLLVVWWIGFAIAVLFLPLLKTISLLAG